MIMQAYMSLHLKDVELTYTVNIYVKQVDMPIVTANTDWEIYLLFDLKLIYC